MLIIGIDPGISGSICFLQNGKIVDVVEMPTMTEGKKNKKQVNGSQIFNEISGNIKKINKEEIKVELAFFMEYFSFAIKISRQMKPRTRTDCCRFGHRVDQSN